jgi:myo-inositol-1(or 4)-monophosphatase
MNGRDERYLAALRIAASAADTALDFFRRPGLSVDRKGHQDLVTEADKAVERQIREALAISFPQDGIVGEEDVPVTGSSGFTWVIDPIDGTANFVAGIPAWTVVLACVSERQTVIGVIHDACHGEVFAAAKDRGATLNDVPISVVRGGRLSEGTVGVGFSNRVEGAGVVRLIQGLVDEGGVFLRNASGALSIAYVAAGRLLGYAEEHMNAWDCLAGQLIVAEAGGRVEEQDAAEMITRGGRVIVAAPGVFEDLKRISEHAFLG